ncbi:hypothetical protein HYFRA_00000578 [Hymenoscyphus fraxineus]|uniref:Uncharacterized protein n=1 Tax=Hymenoscyphus fraxineus TaxID=746836 RepID=A0A9N9L333_9HELO|nr:hypothetical protein HYFRA_00000578 [Hymenoscyphus fraxineus]
MVYTVARTPTFWYFQINLTSDPWPERQFHRWKFALRSNVENAINEVKTNPNWRTPLIQVHKDCGVPLNDYDIKPDMQYLITYVEDIAQQCTVEDFHYNIIVKKGVGL